MEVIAKKDYEVRPILLSVCQHLVKEYHYAGGGSNTAVYCHGLFRRGSSDVLGAAWWLPPTRSCAEASFDGDWRRVLSLSRLVCIPAAPKLSASFLMGNSIKLIRKSGDWDCLVTYADTWRGHTGVIYKATNWEYMGLTKPMPVWADPENNRQIARKSGPKTRTDKEMRSLGYELIGMYPKHKFRIVFRQKAIARTEQLALAL